MSLIRPILRSPVPLACAAMLGLAAALAFGLFGAWSSWLDAFSHFRAHFAVLAALLALLLLATRFRLLAAATLVFSIACFATMPGMPAWFGLGPVQAGLQPKAADQPVYRLLQMNLRFNNATPEQVLSLIGRTQPDVITLEEASAMWQDKLGLLAHAYPHRIYCGGVFGSAILSRRPFAEGSEPKCYTTGTLAVASVDLGGRSIDVAAIHLGWPWPVRQPRQIGRIAEPLAALGETAILAGDCNAVPWSAAVRRVADEGGLTVMPSVGPTWLWRRLPDALRFAGLPIDQVFSKGDIVIHSAEKMSPAGSDHLPILVQFSLKPKPPEAEEPKTATAAAAAIRAGRG